MERLYPIPGAEVAEAISTYPNALEHAWVQEEPVNQGAWSFIALNLPEHLPRQIRLYRVARKATASPAPGAHSAHEREQAELIDVAFAGL